MKEGGLRVGLVASMALSACATPAARVVVPNAVALESTRPITSNGSGDLLVYSATYAPTMEQSEYPVHSNYTIATADDKVIRHVANLSGAFVASPAKITLPAGEYHVRAQYDRGGFVVVPVRIESDVTAIVDLNHEFVPSDSVLTREPIRLPGGRVVGWLVRRR